MFLWRHEHKTATQLPLCKLSYVSLLIIIYFQCILYFFHFSRGDLAACSSCDLQDHRRSSGLLHSVWRQPRASGGRVPQGKASNKQTNRKKSSRLVCVPPALTTTTCLPSPVATVFSAHRPPRHPPLLVPGLPAVPLELHHSGYSQGNGGEEPRHRPPLRKFAHTPPRSLRAPKVFAKSFPIGGGLDRRHEMLSRFCFFGLCSIRLDLISLVVVKVYENKKSRSDSQPVY